MSKPTGQRQRRGPRTISWAISRDDAALVERIADRMAALGSKNASPVPRKLAIVMAITAVHANGCPLDLQRFLDLPEFDFTQDVYSIVHNLDARTGTLLNGFLPRARRV